MYCNVELRKLPAGALCSVINILEINDDWKKVMALIPKNLQNGPFEPKYNYEHVRLIEEHAKTHNLKCTEILFDEWGTSGKIRPTLNTLKDIILNAKIYRAADEIATLLSESAPARPDEGPEAPIDTNVTLLLNDEAMEDKCKENAHRSDKQLSSQNQAIFNRTTVRIKSELDSQGSYNIPKLSDMLTDSTSEHHSKSTQLTELRESDPSTQVVETTNPYQMSLPNITFTSEIDSAILDDSNLIHFNYKQLQTITNNFNEKAVKGDNGLVGRIGSGGFGDVFVGKHPKYGYLAIKKVNKKFTSDYKPELAIKLFNAEVKFLSHFRHENIVPILGFSKDGPSLCIVCEYIEGGSLEWNLAAKVLSESQRYKIIRGTAEGLKYLHTSEKPTENQDLLKEVFTMSSTHTEPSKNYFVHGDVKSANILLTKDCIPKLCDFGLAKQSESTFIMSQPLGTQGYMPIEGYYGTISQKIDIYAYGIVMLELLTGLRAMWSVSKMETISLKDYIQEKCIDDDITNVLDANVNNWTKSKAQAIYLLAKKCVNNERKNRPSIEEICEVLDDLLVTN